MKNTIIEREELSTGEVLVIQRTKRTYCCYVIAVSWMQGPIFLASQTNLAECREVFADRLAEDVCDVF